MARFIKDRSAARGTAPGSLIFIGNKKMEKPVIQLIEYDQDELIEKELEKIGDFKASLKNKKVSWLNIYGIHEIEMFEKLGEILNIRSLFLEDLLNTDQQPLYEDGESYDGFILKMLSYDPSLKKIVSEQITMILGENYVITLQEQIGDVFNPVRERIRQTKRRLRLNDNDYLMYALMDTIVDNYIQVVESLGREIEEISTRIFEAHDPGMAKEIFNFKMEMNYLRKQIRPVREIMLQVLRSDGTYFQEKNMQYLKDLNDLVIQATDAIELYNNMVSDHLNIFNTNVSNRMNEVMKVLTIFASIFIPLTFVAGIYGMNFENIPELRLQYGYFYFWGLILVLIIAIIWYFRKKRWL
jgi:magnesium transporter